MAPKSNDKLTLLRKEISGLLEQIEEAELLFLKQQATTIIYNYTVEEMNRKNQESLLENTRSKKKASPSVGKGSKTPEKGVISLDMGGEAKGFCNVVCGRVRVFFPLEELDAMVYISKKTSSSEAGLLLYRWLKKERGDFLVDNGVTSYPSPLIDDLARYLRGR